MRKRPLPATFEETGWAWEQVLGSEFYPAKSEILRQTTLDKPIFWRLFDRRKEVYGALWPETR